MGTATGGRALTAERRRAILTEIRQAGQARAADLACHLEVSQVTIRTDLEALHKAGHVVRVRGGAVMPAPAHPDALFGERMRRNLQAKLRIARHAASMVADNQSIVLDAGSTMLQLALHLPPFQSLVIATPALNIAQHLMHRPGIDVHVIGGRVNTSTASTIGSDLEQARDGFVAHQVFMSAHAIDSAFDVVDPSHDVARTKRNLVKLGRRVILLVDSSKWFVEGPSKAFSLAQVTAVVTDHQLPDKARRHLENEGTEVRCV